MFPVLPPTDPYPTKVHHIPMALWQSQRAERARRACAPGVRRTRRGYVTLAVVGAVVVLCIVLQFVRGRMYRGGGMAQEQQVRLVEAAPPK